MNKKDKLQPQIFTGTSNPKTAAIEPSKVGDLYIRVYSGEGSAGIYFCKSLTNANKWGTAGTG